MEFKQNILDTVSEEINPKQFNLNHKNLDILIKIIKHLNNDILIFPNEILTSSGSVLVLIFDNFVIKILSNINIFNKIFDILELGYHESNIVTIIGHYTRTEIVNNGGQLTNIDLSELDENREFYCFITENLQQITESSARGLTISYPIFNNPKILLKLCFDILAGLDNLHKNMVEHGDLRLNNIGLRGNNFVIFDFNASRFESTGLDSDIAALIGSILFYSRNFDHTDDMVYLLNFIKSYRTANYQQFYNGLVEYAKENLDIEGNNNQIVETIRAYKL